MATASLPFRHVQELAKVILGSPATLQQSAAVVCMSGRGLDICGYHWHLLNCESSTTSIRAECIACTVGVPLESHPGRAVECGGQGLKKRVIQARFSCWSPVDAQAAFWGQSSTRSMYVCQGRVQFTARG
jgi:hypothetical protein